MHVGSMNKTIMPHGAYKTPIEVYKLPIRLKGISMHNYQVQLLTTLHIYYFGNALADNYARDCGGE